MALWKLTDKEWDALDALRFSTADVNVFRNATLILMSGTGLSKNSLAKELGCCPATVDNVRKRYGEQGLAGLTPRKSPAAACGPRPSIARRSAARCRRRPWGTPSISGWPSTATSSPSIGYHPTAPAQSRQPHTRTAPHRSLKYSADLHSSCLIATTAPARLPRPSATRR